MSGPRETLDIFPALSSYPAVGYVSGCANCCRKRRTDQHAKDNPSHRRDGWHWSATMRAPCVGRPNFVLAARSIDRLDALSARLKGTGKRTIIPVDMSDDASIAAFGSALATFGRPLDGAVLMPPPLPRSTDPFPDSDAWRQNFQRSFIGPLALLKLATEKMSPDVDAGRRAKVVIVSAITSVQVLGHYAASNVLRPAWLGQAKTLAFALGPRGIHVNTVSLGGTTYRALCRINIGAGEGGRANV